MPTVEITKITISHIWDDESKSDIEIGRGVFGDTGPYVSITDDGNTVYLRHESWPKIKEQVQAMFDDMCGVDPDA